MIPHYFFSSVTRNTDLWQQPFQLKSLELKDWSTGDFVAGLVTNNVQRPTIHPQLGYLQIPSSLYCSIAEFLAWSQHQGATGKFRAPGGYMIAYEYLAKIL